jgi:hypothetical protein
MPGLGASGRINFEKLAIEKAKVNGVLSESLENESPFTPQSKTIKEDGIKNEVVPDDQD